MWLPLYRIPEAPLDARFLTYHSLSSLWATAREARAAGRCPAPAKMPPSPFAALGGGGPAGQGAASTTPTAVCAFPGSPTASDAGTRTSSGRAPCSLASEGSRGRARSDSCGSGSGGSAHGSAGGGSAIPSPAASELGDPLESPGGGPAPATPRGVGALPESLPLPVVGLQWYTMPRSVENWVDTLVAAQLPEGAARSYSGAKEGKPLCFCILPLGVAAQLRAYLTSCGAGWQETKLASALFHLPTLSSHCLSVLIIWPLPLPLVRRHGPARGHRAGRRLAHHRLLAGSGGGGQALPSGQGRAHGVGGERGFWWRGGGGRGPWQRCGTVVLLIPATLPSQAACGGRACV